MTVESETEVQFHLNRDEHGQYHLSVHYPDGTEDRHCLYRPTTVFAILTTVYGIQPGIAGGAIATVDDIQQVRSESVRLH